MDVAGNYKPILQGCIGMTPGHQTRPPRMIGYEGATLFSVRWYVLAEHKEQTRFSEAKPKNSTSLGRGDRRFLDELFCHVDVGMATILERSNGALSSSREDEEHT